MQVCVGVVSSDRMSLCSQAKQSVMYYQQVDSVTILKLSFSNKTLELQNMCLKNAEIVTSKVMMG